MSKLNQSEWQEVEAFARQPLPTQELTGKDIYFFAPRSLYGKIYIPALVSKLKPIACIDDLNPAQLSAEIETWSTFKFLSSNLDSQKTILVDFSNSTYTARLAQRICLTKNIQYLDFTKACNTLNQPVIYETPQVLREKTVAALDRYGSLFDSLDDDRSRKVLGSVLTARLSGERRYLYPIISAPEGEYFSRRLDVEGLIPGEEEVFLDVGAHVGTAIFRFLEAADFEFRAVHAFEADSINFRELTKVKALQLENLHVHFCAVLDSTGEIPFQHTGTMGSNIFAEATGKVMARKIDDLAESASIIKLDIEGAEPAALRGASRVISAGGPRIASACYHYATDIVDIADTLKAIRPDYRFRLRHYSSYLGDTCIYASNTESFWGRT